MGIKKALSALEGPRCWWASSRPAEVLAAWLLAALAFPDVAPAQVLDARGVAASLRHNAVRIDAVFDPGKKREQPASGFGFIVGRRDGQVWIATAGHTVWRQPQDGGPQDGGPVKERAGEVRVTYFQAPATDAVAWVSDHFDDSGADLAFIYAEPPPVARWKEKSIATEIVEAGERGAYIGRELDWHVEDATLRSLEFQRHRILIGAAVPGGSSGAPLVSRLGIVGMILTGTEVLSIDYVRQYARKAKIPWNLEPYEPIVDCEPFEVCFDRGDDLDFGRLEIRGGAVRASLDDGDCVTLAPRVRYGLQPDDDRLSCGRDWVSAVCGMPGRLNWTCEINLEGSWRSNWGDVQFVSSLSGGYRFFGFADGPRIVGEGQAYLIKGGRLSLMDQGDTAPILALRSWRAELAMTPDLLSGTATVDGQTLPLYLARGDAVLPAVERPPTPPYHPLGGSGGLSEDEKGALNQLARDYLDLLAAREYRDAYRQASISARSLVSEEAFIAQVSILVGQLGGRGEDRKVIEEKALDFMPIPGGQPLIGKFYTIRFKTRYPAGPVYEDVSLEKEPDGEYRVVGFYFYPAPAL